MAEPVIGTPGPTPTRTEAPQLKRTVWSGVLFGIGFVAFIDETFFHQLLHWHHFYDKSTDTVGLVSDGLFHAGGFTVIVVGLFLMADALRRGGFVPKRWWGSFFIGAGGFQLYDGVVQHKWFGLHQIRYHVTIWPYDLSWNVIAAVMIAVGIALLFGRAGVARSGIFRTSDAPR
ncbi:MAG: DUF2243 domain-containing protein [Actinomycetota bacterium]|nr:DUF2243 domain-containing protein [Actinomycetota bacterium]